MPFAPLCSLVADTATTFASPEIASATPNASFGSAWGAFRIACSVHELSTLVNTYAAPESRLLLEGGPRLTELSSVSAPTTAVPPSALIATAQPKLSLGSEFDALRYACWAHVVPARANTYAAPAEPLELSAPSPLIVVAPPSSSGA